MFLTGLGKNPFFFKKPKKTGFFVVFLAKAPD
jgi:hypothetical protein